MLHVIMRHLLLPALVHLLLWVDRTWPSCDPDDQPIDLWPADDEDDDDKLLDWFVREWDGVPDDPRGLS